MLGWFCQPTSSDAALPTTSNTNLETENEENQTNQAIYTAQPTGLSPLEKLDGNAAWQIIKHVPEAIPALRATSRKMKELMDGMVAEKEMPISICSEIRFSPSEDSTTEICITVLTKWAPLFQLRVKSHPSYWGYRISRAFKSETKDVYLLKFNSSYDGDDLLTFLAESVGNRARTLILYECNDSHTLDVVSAVLIRYSFNSVIVISDDLSELAANHLVQSIRDNEMHSLELEVAQIMGDPAGTLLALAGVLRSLSLRQESAEEDVSPRYLMGLDSYELAPLILEMFGEKLDRLSISNYCYRQYLNRASADELRERLPHLGKKLWFEADCTYIEEDSLTTVNDHVIQVSSGERNWNGKISVKHSSYL